MTATPEQLPESATIVEAIRPLLLAGQHDEAQQLLDNYMPAIDELADVPTAAQWLGISPASIYRERSRRRADGAPAWPAADAKFGRSSAWKYRTLALHRAGMPGRGSAGRGRPRRAPNT